MSREKQTLLSLFVTGSTYQDRHWPSWAIDSIRTWKISWQASRRCIDGTEKPPQRILCVIYNGIESGVNVVFAVSHLKIKFGFARSWLVYWYCMWCSWYSTPWILLQGLCSRDRVFWEWVSCLKSCCRYFVALWSVVKSIGSLGSWICLMLTPQSN